jgi:ribonuclease P protein component
MPVDPPKPRRLGRALRIKQGCDFARLKLAGQRTVNGCVIANWQRHPGQAHSRLGVVVSRKVGGSVVRSRVKRLLRESFRLHQLEFSQPLDLVLVARPSIAGRPFADVEKDFLGAMRRAGLIIPNAGPSTT